MVLGRFLIELFCFSLLDGNSPLRAVPETGAQPIAIGLTDQLRLTINYLQGTLDTGWDAETSAVTLILINFDYFSQCLYCHFRPSLCSPAHKWASVAAPKLPPPFLSQTLAG